MAGSSVWQLLSMYRRDPTSFRAAAAAPGGRARAPGFGLEAGDLHQADPVAVHDLCPAQPVERPQPLHLLTWQWLGGDDANAGSSSIAPIPICRFAAGQSLQPQV